MKLCHLTGNGHNLEIIILSKTIQAQKKKEILVSSFICRSLASYLHTRTYTHTRRKKEYKMKTRRKYVEDVERKEESNKRKKKARWYGIEYGQKT